MFRALTVRNSGFWLLVLDSIRREIYGPTLGPLLVSVYLTQPDHHVLNRIYAEEFPLVSLHPQLHVFGRATQALRSTQQDVLDCQPQREILAVSVICYITSGTVLVVPKLKLVVDF